MTIGSEEVRSVCFIKNTKLEKPKENRLDIKDHTLFQSNINSTPFIPYYSLNSQLDVSYDDSEIILTDEKLVFKSLKDAIIEVFLNFSTEMSSWISDNIQLPLFLMSIPLIPIKLNKISYDSRNFLINYSFQNFNQELSCGLTLMPYENKKYHFESDFEPDKDNIYSADFGSFFEFQIYQFNQHGIPDYLLLKGRMGVSEEDIRELDISKISSDDIIKLCKQGENKFVEFKDEKILNKEGRAHLLLEIEAFANTSSGLIIIGVGDLADNKGEILGIDESMKKRNKTKEGLVMLVIENWIKELDPIPSINGKCIDVNGTGHSVILLKIDYDESKTPITYNGKIVTRVHSSVNPASQSEIIRLINRRSRSW